ncbi:MAG: sensor histidine kinase, partial [Romboutsia sp.]|uniref:sensor histidine kinase n=1 Tax=Romboutsia sp. TaxID=1965302 RepID=UPI003F3D966C
YIDNQFQNELNIHSEVIFNIEKSFEEQETASNSVINGINTQPNILDEINILTNSTYEEYISYKLDNYNESNVKQIDLKYLLDTILSNRNDALAVVLKDKDKEYKNEFVLKREKWYPIKNKQENAYTRRITKPIKNIDTMYTIGYIDIYFDLSKLSKVVKNSNLKGGLFIFNENKDLIFNSNEVLNHSKSVHQLEKEENAVFNVLDSNIKTMNTEDSIISLKEYPKDKFKYISIINEKELGMEHMKLQIFVIALMCIVVIIFITYLIIYIYSSKLNKMINGINEIKNGNLNTRFNIIKEDDELDMIAIRIDEMSSSLQESINKNYISEVKQKQAEISALQAQINPHFLYNTLEVIRMCALANKTPEVANMIYNLANMFRYSTYNNGSIVSLNEEVKYCTTYLNLCSIRYKGIMKYDIKIDREIENCLVPKFIIQPIVENSINHGLRKDHENNFITISATRLDHEIEIMIKDNGVGMSKDRLDKLEEGLIKDLKKSSSIGLMNINNRLKLKFGQEYGIKIKSKEGKGTTVKIKLPILRDEGENV